MKRKMKQEHTREDELEIQIIGLQGKIESLKKEKQELIEKFIEFLSEFNDNHFLKYHEIDGEIEKYKKSLQKKEIMRIKKGIPYKSKCHSCGNETGMFMISEWFFGLIKRVHCVECVYNKRVRKTR